MHVGPGEQAAMTHCGIHHIHFTDWDMLCARPATIYILCEQQPSLPHSQDNTANTKSFQRLYSTNTVTVLTHCSAQYGLSLHVYNVEITNHSIKTE